MTEHQNAASTQSDPQGPLLSARLWVVLLWSLTLAVGLAGWDWGERRFEDAAAGQTIVLLPKASGDDAERQTIAGKLSAEPGVLDAHWLAPAELTRRIAGRFPQTEWQELFPADEAWLTWMLEVRPSAPLDSLNELQSFAARRQEEGTWRMVIWDPPALAELAAQRGRMRIVLGFWMLLAALAGAVALLRLPPHGRRWSMAAWSALLGLLGPGAVWSSAVLAGLPADVRSLAIALGAGFLLATLIAPMLRLR